MADQPTMFCPACGAVRDVDATKPCSSCGDVPTVVRGGVRIARVTPAIRVTEVSPTGKPIIPTHWVPYVGAVTGIALLAAGVAEAIPGLGTQVASAAGIVGAIGLWLLGLSPGLRQKGQ